MVLAAAVRHLDHKNVSHDPEVKSNVIRTATALARQIRSGAILSDIGFVSDLCRHLRKSLQATVESVGEHELNLNISLQNSVEDCLLETAKWVQNFVYNSKSFSLVMHCTLFEVLYFPFRWLMPEPFLT